MKYNKKKMSLKEKIKSCFMTEIEEQLENINGEISSKKEKLNSLKKEILELKYSINDEFNKDSQEKIINTTSKTYKIVGIIERPASNIENYFLNLK